MDSELTMFAESFYIPKIELGKPPRGQDAHFICKEAQVFGVADGVGGWLKRGIDAGEYARRLMENAEEYARNSHFSADADPKSILTNAYYNTRVRGSSTACILSLDGDLLRAANVGDSGFMVIRGGTTVFQSPRQQWAFDTPYQLGVANSRPDEAVEMAVRLEMDDVVVAGTDGLFDNMFTEEVEETVERCLLDEMRPIAAARELAMEAKRKSLDRSGATPFEFDARKAGKRFSGGKYDDITVVVAYVLSHGAAVELERELEDDDDDDDDDDDILVDQTPIFVGDWLQGLVEWLP